MHPKAKIYRQAKSPYWRAWFLIWDAKRQEWRACAKSTRSTDATKALEIAREYERLALAAGPDGSTRLSRDFVISVINDILRISGHREVQDGKPWDEYSTAWLNAAHHRLSKGTWQTYKGHLANFSSWLGKDASIPLSAVTGEVMQEWYRSTIKSGLASTTVNNMATTLSTIFERAKDEGFTTRNPVNLIDRDDHEGNTRDPFTPEDMDAILAYLAATPERQDWLTVALLGLCTSQRLTDCSNATWDQFTETSPFWVWTFRQQKTGKEMRIPIVDPLAAHLKQLRKNSQAAAVAPSLAGLPSSGFQTGLSWQFGEILTAAGVTGRKIEGKGKGRGFRSKTFHSTRHTCNSLLANAGIPADVRKMITGHSDTATNLDYTHLTDQTKAKALVKAFARKKSEK